MIAAIHSGSAQVPFQHVVIDDHSPGRPHCKATGDINGDGFADVVVGSAGGDGLFWYQSPNWTKHRIHVGAFTTDAQKADMNNNGDLDVVTSEMEQSPRRRVSVYWNLGKSLQWKQQVISTDGSHNIRVADLNHDGWLDIIGANHGNYGGPTPVQACLSQAGQKPASDQPKASSTSPQ